MYCLVCWGEVSGFLLSFLSITCWLVCYIHVCIYYIYNYNLNWDCIICTVNALKGHVSRLLLASFLDWPILHSVTPIPYPAISFQNVIKSSC